MSDRKTRALNELESGRLMASYGINMVKSEILKSDDLGQIHEIASRTGFPVAMKVLSDDILHKTDAGCVVLGVNSEKDMADAYRTIMANAKKNVPGAVIQGVLVQQMMDRGLEVLLGVSTDPQFGHVVMVGLGGIMVELLKAVSIRVLPITRFDAEEMIDETPLKTACKGLRGTVYDKQEIVDALLALSKLVKDHPEVKEIDINPLIMYGNGKPATGVDAVVVLND